VAILLPSMFMGNFTQSSQPGATMIYLVTRAARDQFNMHKSSMTWTRLSCVLHQIVNDKSKGLQRVLVKLSNEMNHVFMGNFTQSSQPGATMVYLVTRAARDQFNMHKSSMTWTRLSCVLHQIVNYKSKGLQRVLVKLSNEMNHVLTWGSMIKDFLILAHNFSCLTAFWVQFNVSNHTQGYT
jgi:RsiW-degrading membrane proteinase PrsW (M82 family)